MSSILVLLGCFVADIVSFKIIFNTMQYRESKEVFQKGKSPKDNADKFCSIYWKGKINITSLKNLKLVILT